MTKNLKADASYNAIGLVVGGAAEILLGIIVSCSILLPKLFQAKGKTIRAVFSKPSREGSRESNNAPEFRV